LRDGKQRILRPHLSWKTRIMMDIVTENWAELALALITFLSTYTALTASSKDDKILAIAKRVIQAIVFGSVVKDKVKK